MRIRQALAPLAVLAVAAGTLTACNDDTAASRPARPLSQRLAVGVRPGRRRPPAEDAGDAGSGGHLDRTASSEAITVGPPKAGSAHMTMTMTGAMAVTAEGDVAYEDAGPEMRMTMRWRRWAPARWSMRLVDGIVYMTIPRLTPPGSSSRSTPRTRPTR